MITDSRRTVRQSTSDAHGAASVHNTNKNKSNKIPQDPNKRGSKEDPNKRGSKGAPRRRHQQQNMHALLPDLMKMLGASMEARLHECAVSDDEKARADRCFEELQAVVLELGPRWRLEVFGSVASGFSTGASDMDATCVQAPAEDGEEESPAAQTILQERLSPLLHQHKKFQVIEEIINAKVPILRLRFDGCLDIDLSCENTAALLNTRLLSAYARLHPRVRELGIAVKLWAKAARVCGAKQGNLSSYSFTLLVIYFMQVHHEVKLPCLSPSLFEENPSVAEVELQHLRKSWSCNLTLAELFFRFIGFYSLFFDWGREVVSARCGKRIWSRDPAFQMLRGRYVSRLHIEDPYALERNLHCVLGEAEEVELREAFQAAWYAMINASTPVGLRPLGIGSSKIEIQLSEHTGPVSQEGLADNAVNDEDTFTGEGAMDEMQETFRGVPMMKASVNQSLAAFSSCGSTESGDDKCPPHVPSSSSGDSNENDDEYMTVLGDLHPVLKTQNQVSNDVTTAPSKQWWQSLATANVAEVKLATVPEPKPESQHEEHPRIMSLEDLESRMVKDWDEAQRHAAEQILESESPYFRECDLVVEKHEVPTESTPDCFQEGGNVWWRNLGSANVKQAVEASGQEEEGGRWSRRKRGLKQQGVTVQDLEGKMIQESPQDFEGKMIQESPQEICDPDSREHHNSTILPLFGRSFASTSSNLIAARVANRCLVQA